MSELRPTDEVPPAHDKSDLSLQFVSFTQLLRERLEGVRVNALRPKRLPGEF